MRALTLPVALAITLSAFALVSRQNRVLVRTFVGTGAMLLLWAVVLCVKAKNANRTLSIVFDVRRQHWLQACAQTTVLLYWVWHARIVFVFLPFIVAQLIFAYACRSAD
ncbi:MAG: hypothetical protein ACT4P6_12190 [Gemmatimonadaceae bacterium]